MVEMRIVPATYPNVSNLRLADGRIGLLEFRYSLGYNQVQEHVIWSDWQPVTCPTFAPREPKP